MYSFKIAAVYYGIADLGKFLEFYNINLILGIRGGLELEQYICCFWCFSDFGFWEKFMLVGHRLVAGSYKSSNCDH